MVSAEQLLDFPWIFGARTGAVEENPARCKPAPPPLVMQVGWRPYQSIGGLGQGTKADGLDFHAEKRCQRS